MGPQLLRALVPALPDGQGKELPRLLLPSAPPPWLVGLLRDEAPQRIRFPLQTPDDPLPGRRARQPMQRIRQRRKASDDTAHEPSETAAASPAHTRQRDFLATEACSQGTLCVTDPPMVRVEANLAPTRLALMVLRPSVPMTISLEALGTPCRTHCSQDHNALLPPCAPLVFLPQYPRIVSTALLV
jgi:hypothetical protein